jgi:serine/threonine-protein kinase
MAGVRDQEHEKGIAEEHPVNEGERLGKYRVARELEPGLLLADRVEDFEQQVAVALVPGPLAPGSQSEFLERRGKLGAMNHPVIPRLLDSGETAGREAYLLFEFVPAEPALAVAHAEKWALARRIAMAIHHLDALAVAHGSLLAHGRLTAESFCVTAAGQARLSIFPSVVSSADPAGDDLSAAVQLLSKLLSDCGLPRLPGDLNAILRKATHKELAAAYTSASSLAADLRSFLARKPVSARKATPAYRVALFARRRPELFYPSLILATAVLVAAVYSVAMDISARRSRDRAQARLRQMQQLTYSLESGIYEPVSKLPNSKAARETLIRWTVESLDSLAAQAGNDLQLRSQLAQSFNRLAQMQRSEGDTAGALVSEQRARDLLADHRTQ